MVSLCRKFFRVMIIQQDITNKIDVKSHIGPGYRDMCNLTTKKLSDHTLNHF